MSLFRAFLALAVVFVLVLGWGIHYEFFAPNNMTNKAVIVIEKGDNSKQVAKKLEQAGVIKSHLLFYAASRVLGLHRNLKAGEYVFYPNVNMSQVLKIVVEGKIVYRKITLQEGLTTAQMLEIIANDNNLVGNISIKVKEGELLPETYSYSKGDSRDFIIKTAQKAMAKTLEKEWKNNKNPQVKSKEELLILASIIEKETSLAAERQDISAVFSSRLRIGMRLQTDPTVIYAITNGKKNLGRALYKKDLKIDSPFNTYKNYGLPPAPICNPGEEALFAAANPSDSKYLYFVASGDGGHLFANTLKEHNKNVSIYRQKRRKK